MISLSPPGRYWGIEIIKFYICCLSCLWQPGWYILCKMGRLYENLSWTDQDCLSEASDWEVGVHSISSSRIVLFCFVFLKKREEKRKITQAV